MDCWIICLSGFVIVGKKEKKKRTKTCGIPEFEHLASLLRLVEKTKENSGTNIGS